MTAAKTYGRLQYLPPKGSGAGGWLISDLEPHVSVAFKRLFDRVRKTDLDIVLADTDLIRVDLHWFMLRYPLQHVEAQMLQEGIARVTTKAAERERLLAPSWTPGKLTGWKENRAPYPYQVQAARLAINNPSLLLGDDLGLGKTISALAAIVEGPKPAAVVVQTHLAQQWADRAAEFTHLRTHIIKGTKPYDLPSADIYVWKYSNIVGWNDVLARGVCKTVIFDEIQELRHGTGSQKGQTAEHMVASADVSMGLTATPIYNYGNEIFNVMQYVQRDLLGRKHEFDREWCPDGKRVKNPQALGAFLRDAGFFLRRTEHDEEVNTQIPALNRVVLEVPWDEDDVGALDDLTRMLAQTVLSGSFTERGKAARELDLRMRMRTGVAKARGVAAYVDMLLQERPRVLLAGWHRDVYDIWGRALERHKPVLYTGTESAAGKRRSVDAFTKGDSRVMMISLRSGAGLDGLQDYCSDVVFGEFDWSPQVHKQVAGRLRRPGQRDEVTAHYLHTSGGSDPVIMGVLGLKASQSRGIVDPFSDIEQQQSDDSRIKELARQVLEKGAAL